MQRLMDEKKMMKMAVIAGASEAMKFKDKNPSASADEVIRHVNSKSSEIISKINTEQ